MGLAQWLLPRLNRRKTIKDCDMAKTNLSRCLTTLDLTALGIGSTMGAGAYVISGTVAKTTAGPAVVISFLIAALASILAGLCYAEFGARVPKAGSAYIYTYVSIGELLAFIIGWNVILEYVIGAACLSRATSGYIDGIIGDDKVLVKWFREYLPINVPSFAESCDLLAVAIPVVLTVVLAFGVKESVTLNKVFTALNMCILIYVMGASLFVAQTKNWSLSAAEVWNKTVAQGKTCSDKDNGIIRTDCGQGGFAPYGIQGIIAGAATCFFAFIGFDVIATTGEEAKTPQKSIPIATIVSLTIIFFMYFGVSTAITMMAPYYDLDTKAPFARLFVDLGWTVSKYVVSIGAICALTTSLLGAMFPLPRIVLSMARDGLIFKVFARVHSRLQTPTIATIFCGVLASLLAAVFDVEALVEMMSIGTLLAYTLVAVSVVILRYDVAPEDVELARSIAMESSLQFKDDLAQHESQQASQKLREPAVSNSWSLSNLFKPRCTYPTTETAQLVKILTSVLLICVFGLCLIFHFCPNRLFFEKDWFAWIVVGIVFVLCSIFVFIISRQPESCKKLFFKVPLVSILPVLSIGVNLFLMLSLEMMTWIRFGIWMTLGFMMYFGYGIRHSSEEKAYRNAGEKIDDQIESINDFSKNDKILPNLIESDPKNGKLNLQIGFDDVKL